MSFKDYLKGTYAAVSFSEDSKEKIKRLLEGLPNPIKIDDLHCTLLYSRKYLPNYEPLNAIKEECRVNGFKVFTTRDEKRALVLTLDSEFLVNRHNELMKEHEATYDYPEYIPHITISYDIEDMSIHDIEKMNFNDTLYIINEYKEDLNLNWKGD